MIKDLSHSYNSLAGYTLCLTKIPNKDCIFSFAPIWKYQQYRSNDVMIHHQVQLQIEKDSKVLSVRYISGDQIFDEIKIRDKIRKTSTSIPKQGQLKQESFEKQQIKIQFQASHEQSQKGFMYSLPPGDGHLSTHLSTRLSTTICCHSPVNHYLLPCVHTYSPVFRDPQPLQRQLAFVLLLLRVLGQSRVGGVPKRANAFEDESLTFSNGFPAIRQA